MLHSIRLQHWIPRAWHVSCETAQTAAGMSGLAFPRYYPLRALLSFVLLAAGVSWFDWADDVSARFAVSCFVLLFGLRIAYLFASFNPGGIASWLKARLGPERAFVVHESIMTALLFMQRLSFLELLYATSHPVSSPIGAALVSVGVLFAVVGLVVSVWATRVVGLDTYYYRDLFMGPGHVSVELRGPYAFLGDPMYGAGQLAAYGAALVALSPIGLVAAALNQVALYIFNDAVEQPRLRAAKGVFMETQLRYALSRTLVDDPRAELRRRASRPPRRVRRG